MGKPRTGKGLSNEVRYPYVVELASNPHHLELIQRIRNFHNSRNIRVRYGRRIIRENQAYVRWCFPDFVTALAFVQQFGGEVLPRKSEIGPRTTRGGG
jgi:hypothetical protein